MNAEPRTMNSINPLRLLAAAIRIISFLFGCLIIVASIPMALIGGAMPQETVPLVSPLLTVPLAACVLASGFLSFGIVGADTVNALKRRVISAVLLLMPLGLGASYLLAPIHQQLRGQGLFFFVPALVVLLCTLWPNASQPAQLSEKECSEP